jgi:hypothetical protein
MDLFIAESVTTAHIKRTTSKRMPASLSGTSMKCGESSEGHHSDLVIALALAVWAADYDSYTGGFMIW